MRDFRCKNCNKLLAKYRKCEELEIKCPRCSTKNYLQVGRKEGILPNSSYAVAERAVR